MLQAERRIIFNGGNSVAEVDAAGTFLATYVQSGAIDEPLAQLRNGAAGYYEQDGLGSVTSIAGTAGTQINSDTYDSFGNLTGSTGSFTNPFQYTGRDNDSETGLLYYRTRYYDPGVARFISEDPMGFETGTNFYSYVAGNPISFTDPTGLCEDQKPKARPKRRPCRINIGIPAHVEARDEETQRILAAAGIDLEFVGTNQNPDFALEYKDLSSMRALGYAGAGPNLIELDGPAIYRKGAGLGASNTAILVAAGVILAHELGHKLIGPGHADAGIMRPGFDIGDIVFQGMDMGGGLFFTPAQIPIILHKCREIRRLHPLSK